MKARIGLDFTVEIPTRLMKELGLKGGDIVEVDVDNYHNTLLIYKAEDKKCGCSNCVAQKT